MWTFADPYFGGALKRDDFSSNRHLAPSFCLGMISAQTVSRCREGKPVSTLLKRRGLRPMRSASAAWERETAQHQPSLRQPPNRKTLRGLRFGPACA
jgi:hypothetical protein